MLRHGFFFFQLEITMLENGQYICVDCHYVTAKRSNWFKHRRKHLGKMFTVKSY